MKIYICYPSDGTAVSVPCKLFFGKDKPTEDWHAYADLDFAVPEGFCEALLRYLKDYNYIEGQYDDVSFRSPVPTSALVFVAALEQMLRESKFVRIAYTLTMDALKTDERLEYSRRVVLP